MYRFNNIETLIYYYMGVEQKETLKFIMDWGAKLVFGVLAYLAVTSFQDLRTDIKQVSTDMQGIRERLIRIETKQESKN